MTPKSASTVLLLEVPVNPGVPPPKSSSHHLGCAFGVCWLSSFTWILPHIHTHSQSPNLSFQRLPFPNSCTTPQMPQAADSFPVPPALFSLSVPSFTSTPPPSENICLLWGTHLDLERCPVLVSHRHPHLQGVLGME